MNPIVFRRHPPLRRAASGAGADNRPQIYEVFT